MTAQAQKREEAVPAPLTVNNSAPSEAAPDKLTIRRPARVQLSPEETRLRMEAFTTEREEAFIAAVREDES